MFKLNGVQIKSPNSFKIERYTLTKSTRVASGDMVMDFVANKRKFVLGYNSITSTELNTIIDIVWTNLEVTKKCFVNFEYPENYGVVKPALVYAGAIPTDLHRADGRVWVWKNVQISLIER